VQTSVKYEARLQHAHLHVITAHSELHKVLFLALSVTFSLVHEISPEQLNRFAPNSQGRRAWSLARTSLNVKVKDQGHQGKMGFSADISGIAELICAKFPQKTCLVPWSLTPTSLKVKVNFGGLHAVYVWKTSLL